jgi:glycosyltransferase involved in cell wall biosynthesis
MSLAMEQGLVSTIVPVFNRAGMLAEAVGSALGETYRPIEIVIVDDGSTDDTPDAITALAAKHPEIRTVRRPNGGPGLARESGRQTARGEFIQYLDSDDLILPRKCELLMRALRERPECGVAYGKTKYTGADGREIACTWKDASVIGDSIFPSFLLGRLWETATPLYRADVLEKAGPWTPLRLEEDWEYDCRIGSHGVTLAFVDEFVAVHRDHPDERLSRGAAIDAKRLRDRAAAHELITVHAQRAGMTADVPEMQHFARELFLLARQSGAAGLPRESKRLFDLSRQTGGTRLKHRAYRAAAALLGWSAAGRLACLSDRLR